ncbi:MAG TPA: hypothetical protein VHD84_02620 [Candidatus Saccharimonadales bacterium]|nr:hypothetical protein [Candidatus Saccharimonadales bacterium]
MTHDAWTSVSITAKGNIKKSRLPAVERILGAEGLAVTVEILPVEEPAAIPVHPDDIVEYGNVSHRPEFWPLRETIARESDYFVADDFKLTPESSRYFHPPTVSQAFSKILIPRLTTGTRYRGSTTPDKLGLKVAPISDVGLAEGAVSPLSRPSQVLAIEAGSFIEFAWRLNNGLIKHTGTTEVRGYPKLQLGAGSKIILIRAAKVLQAHLRGRADL